MVTLPVLRLLSTVHATRILVFGLLASLPSFLALFGLLAVSVLVAQGFYEIAKNRVEKVDNTYEKKVSFFTRLKNIPNTFELRL